MVRQWYLRYKKYGVQGLRSTRSYHYTAYEKAKIVKECAVKGLSLQETDNVGKINGCRGF